MAGACPAHPRSRGENHRLTAGIEDAGGSSPLTRGKPRPARLETATTGLIPAHAGKTAGPMKPPKPASAHPRSRGENCDAVGHVVADGGSSPLTRGKRRQHAHGLPLGRLIPAHAGKTPGSGGVPSWPTAHPRSRGENAVMHAYSIYTRGSSPLTRGKPGLPKARRS